MELLARGNKSWFLEELMLRSALAREDQLLIAAVTPPERFRGLEGYNWIIVDDVWPVELPDQHKPKADWKASALERLQQAKQKPKPSSLLSRLVMRLDA